VEVRAKDEGNDPPPYSTKLCEVSTVKELGCLLIIMCRANVSLWPASYSRLYQCIMKDRSGFI